MKKSEFKKSITPVRPSSFLHYRDFLRSIFKTVLQIRPDMSYSDFSQLCGLPASNVIDHIIKGRRPLSQKASVKISEAFGLKGLERSFFLSLVQYNNSSSAAEADKYLKKILEVKSKLLKSPVNKMEMEYFSKWYNTVIGEMTRLNHFKSDPE